MAEADITSAGTGDWNAGATWTGGAVPDTDQHAIIQSGHNVTINADDEVKSLTVNSGGTLTGNSSYSLTINGEGNASYGTNGYAVRIHSGSTLGTNVKLIVETQADTWATLNAGSGTLDSLTINHASCNLILQAAATLAGNLTITAGELDTHSNNYALTVTGDTNVSGTLTCNSSAVSLAGLTIPASGTVTAPDASGSLTITDETGSYAILMSSGGTFTHSGGTVHISMTGKNTLIYGLEGTDVSGTGANALNNLTVTLSNSNRLELDQAVGTSHTIKGNVTIVEGHFKPDSTGHSLTIEGDVSIESGGTIGATNRTGDHTFGSLTIESGGTYIATSGTTTITNENSSGFAIQNSGTFTHNKGLVDIDFTSPTTTQASNGPYYDFTQSDAATDFYPAEAFEVMNNLSFVGDWDYQNNAHHLTVHGNMTIGDGTTTTRYMPYNTRTCNLTVGGILEVTNGATLTNFSHGTINVGGVRNTGGTM